MTWLLLVLGACDKGSGELAVELNAAQQSRVLAMIREESPPEDPTNRVAEDPRAVALGQWLYFDERLSADGQVACGTCHAPDLGFGDGLALSEGQSTTARHAPSVLNTAFNRWFFWDGRADSHWAQALGPLESAVEHGGSRLQVAHTVYADDAVRAAYEALFGPMPELSDAGRFPASGRPVPDEPEHPDNQAWGTMTEADQHAVTEVFVNLGKSLAAYERTLVTGDAPIDRFARALQEGDTAAAADELSEQAQEGLALFVGDAGCHFCHAGPQLTDLEFHNIGLAQDGATVDTGRYAGVTLVQQNPFNGLGEWSDDPSSAELRLNNLAEGDHLLGQFKTPGLRSVSLHPPYMQRGQKASLREVVEHYNQLTDIPEVGHRDEQLLPLELDEAQLDALVAFLEEALLAEPPPAERLEAPVSPVP